MTPTTGDKEIEEKEPVLVVTDKIGRLVHAGQPDEFDKKLIGEYAQKGYQIKTITIKINYQIVIFCSNIFAF